jgi:hypothetical protein
MNRWLLPPLADVGAKEKTKEKQPTKKRKTLMGKRKRMTAHIAKSLDVSAPTRTPHTINVSGTKAAKDGVPAQSAMSWKLISNPGQSSAPNWEDGLNWTNDGVRGQQKRRMIR